MLKHLLHYNNLTKTYTFIVLNTTQDLMFQIVFHFIFSYYQYTLQIKNDIINMHVVYIESI